MKGLLLVLCLAILASHSFAQSSTTPGQTVDTETFQSSPKCPPYAAWTLLMKDGESGPFGSFIAVLRKTGLTQEYKALTKNQAILAPTNQAMAKALSRLDFVKKAGGGLQPNRWGTLTPYKKNQLMNLFKKTIVSPETFRKRVKPKNACQLISACFDIGKKWYGLVNKGKELWPGQFSNTAPAAIGRKLAQSSCKGAPDCNFNAVGLGVGYNVYTGIPATTLAGGVDPGILYNAIFDFSNQPGVQVSAGNGACSETNSVSASYTYSSFQQQQTATASGSASYGKDSFSASGEWSSDTDTTNEDKAATYSGGTTVNLYTYNFPTSLSDIVISDQFQNDCWYVLQDYAYAGNIVDSWTTQDLFNIYHNYGTSYISSINSGAVANVFIQMSATGESSLSNQGISVSATATASFGLASGSVSGSYDEQTAQDVKTAATGGSFTYQLAPSNVDVPLSSTGTSVDCSAWTSWLKGNSTQAPMTYTIVNISNVFSAYRSSFTTCPAGTVAANSSYPCFTSNDLHTLSTLVANYMQNCAPNPGSCMTTSGACNTGYYGTGFNNQTDSTNCTSCYTGGNHCLSTQGCSSTTGACINLPTTQLPGLYAAQYSNYFGCASSCAQCPTPLTTTSGQTRLQSTSTSDLYQFNYLNGAGQEVFTWQLTGYLVPSVSANYYFRFQTDNCGYMWLDSPGTSGGAKTGTPTAVNAFLNSNNINQVSNPVGVSLTGGQAYPVRFQFGNAPCNGCTNNPSYLSLWSSTDNSNWQQVTGAGQVTFYYYPTTTGSATAPGY